MILQHLPARWHCTPSACVMLSRKAGVSCFYCRLIDGVTIWRRRHQAEGVPQSTRNAVWTSPLIGSRKHSFLRWGSNSACLPNSLNGVRHFHQNYSVDKAGLRVACEASITWLDWRHLCSGGPAAVVRHHSGSEQLCQAIGVTSPASVH